MEKEYEERELYLDAHQKEPIKVMLIKDGTEIALKKRIKTYRIHLTDDQLNLLALKIEKAKQLKKARQHQKIEDFL